MYRIKFWLLITIKYFVLIVNIQKFNQNVQNFDKFVNHDWVPATLFILFCDQHFSDTNFLIPIHWSATTILKHFDTAKCFRITNTRSSWKKSENIDFGNPLFILSINCKEKNTYKINIFSLLTNSQFSSNHSIEFLFIVTYAACMYKFYIIPTCLNQHNIYYVTKQKQELTWTK